MKNKAFLLFLFVGLAVVLCNIIAVSGRERFIKEDLMVEVMNTQDPEMVNLELEEDKEMEDQTEGRIPRRMVITTNDYNTGPNNAHNPGKGGR